LRQWSEAFGVVCQNYPPKALLVPILFWSFDTAVKVLPKMTVRMLYPKIILTVFEAFNFLADATQISKAQILHRCNHGLCKICA
jgi:hypothetical protein